MLGFKKSFSDLHPICYKISVRKEIIKRHIKNFFSRDKIAKTRSDRPLPALISSFQTNMIKRAPGVDLTSQLNKAENIRLASSKINGMLIHPGETFSFWLTVGNTTRKKGFKEGRIINHRLGRRLVQSGKLNKPNSSPKSAEGNGISQAFRLSRPRRRRKGLAFCGNLRWI